MASVPAPVPERTSPIPSPTAALTESHAILSREMRRLTRVATFVAIIASPSVFYWFHHHSGMRTGKALILTFLAWSLFGTRVSWNGQTYQMTSQGALVRRTVQ